jgi:hypothetical protein
MTPPRKLNNPVTREDARWLLFQGLAGHHDALDLVSPLVDLGVPSQFPQLDGMFVVMGSSMAVPDLASSSPPLLAAVRPNAALANRMQQEL